MRCTNLKTLLLTCVLTACSTAPQAPVNDQADMDYHQALTLMQAGRQDEAIVALNALIESYPELAGPHANLGQLYRQRGAMAQASAAFDQALALKPQSAQIYNNAAVHYRSVGRFKDAEAAYLKAIDIAPDYAEPLLNLGILYDIYLNRPAAAADYYREYLALSDKRADEVRMWLLDLERRAGL